ncbi:hypothetical protein [Neobacillus mesonae]|uniref:hypothetical protein n=1 Tax=Neobacillus mesonae TaxID=1193713 RepID=UPI002E1D8505|nr:hypothetical protein [Neobacillus mesonae]
MTRFNTREKGDRYLPIVTIEKMKKDVPSVIVVSGFRYIRDDSSRSISKKRFGNTGNYKK